MNIIYLVLAVFSIVGTVLFILRWLLWTDSTPPKSNSLPLDRGPYRSTVRMEEPQPIRKVDMTPCSKPGCPFCQWAPPVCSLYFKERFLPVIRNEHYRVLLTRYGGDWTKVPPEALRELSASVLRDLIVAGAYTFEVKLRAPKPA